MVADGWWRWSKEVSIYLSRAARAIRPEWFCVPSRPLQRNSTSIRASTNVLPRYVGIDRVGVEPRRGRRSQRGDDFRRDYPAILLHVLFRVTHPLLDRHFPALPHELANRDHAGDPHAAHQHHEDAADVRQAELVRRRAALRSVVLPMRNID